jgi:hypothetical protein
LFGSKLEITMTSIWPSYFTVNPMIDVNEQEDISGDSIRKKREHIKKAYPLIYADCVYKIRSRGA